MHKPEQRKYAVMTAHGPRAGRGYEAVLQVLNGQEQGAPIKKEFLEAQL